MYKVFVQDKPIYFISERNHSLINSIPYSINETQFTFEEIINKTLLGKTYSIYDIDSFEQVKNFFQNYELIEAAGGIIEAENHFLMIKRFGKWDLPKGKIEQNESAETAAEREIMEECGISDLKHKDFICHTYHIFNGYGKNWLKKTHWYSFCKSKIQDTILQVEEDITDSKWMTKDEFKSIDNTYENIKDVIKQYFN